MTMRRSYFKARSRLATISIAAAIAIAAWMWRPAQVAADQAPDWLRAASQDKLPDYPKDTEAVVLLEEQYTTVKDNGEIETRCRRAYRLLRPEGREGYGGVAVHFDSETKLTYLKAWTITADGAAIELKEKEAVEAGLSSYEIYSDKRVKYLKFPEANPGSVVGYEYVQKHRPFVFEDDWWFQSRIPTRKARFVLQIPSGWEYTNYWAHYPEQKAESRTVKPVCVGVAGYSGDRNGKGYAAVAGGGGADGREVLSARSEDEDENDGHVEGFRTLVWRSYRVGARGFAANAAEGG